MTFEEAWAQAKIGRTGHLIIAKRYFKQGYEAAQPKPCVWKWQLGIMGYPGCQDGSGPPSPANGPYCHNCGGKIEESE